VVILSDDMGISDLGCYGGEIRTENLDALARNGIRFSQFYNPEPAFLRVYIPTKLVSVT
jgi:arylsulfatase A-like enzyme